MKGNAWSKGHGAIAGVFALLILLTGCGTTAADQTQETSVVESDSVAESPVPDEEQTMTQKEAQELVSEILPPVWQSMDDYNYAYYSMDLATTSQYAKANSQAMATAAQQLRDAHGWPVDVGGKAEAAASVMETNAKVLQKVADTDSFDKIPDVMQAYDQSTALRDLREAVGLELPPTAPVIEVVDMQTESSGISEYTNIKLTIKSNVLGTVDEVFINYNVKDPSGNIVATGQVCTNPVHLEHGATAPATGRIETKNLQPGYRIVPVEWQILHTPENVLYSEQYDPETVESFEVK